MRNLVLKIIRGSYPSISSKYSRELKNLIDMMLRRNPRSVDSSIVCLYVHTFVHMRVYIHTFIHMYVRMWYVSYVHVIDIVHITTTHKEA